MASGTPGKKLTHSFYGRTKDECREKHREYVEAHPNGPPTPQQREPLNALISAYLAARIAPPYGKQGTLEDYASKIALHIEPTIGLTPYRELRQHDINMWAAALYNRISRGRTVEKCVQIVRAALEYGVENGLIETNPAAKAKAPAYERRRARPLTLGEVRAVLEAAAGRLDKRKPYTTRDGRTKRRPKVDVRLEAIYIVLLMVGLRRGEALALRWGDLRDGVLHIERQVDDEGREWGYVKTDSSRREVALPDEVLDALSVHQSRMQAEAHDEARKPDGLMFPTGAGTAMLPSNLTRHFKTVLAAAGLPATVRLHDLRHTVGTTAEAAGVPVGAISALLGHSSPAITQRLYVHGDKEGAKVAARAMGRKVRGE